MINVTIVEITEEYAAPYKPNAGKPSQPNNKIGSSKIFVPVLIIKK